MRKILFILAAMLLGSIGLHAGNTITYTASGMLDGEEGNLLVGATTFGPAITSHTFSNGTGTITCNGEITTIGAYAFKNCRSLTSIDIPTSVTTIGNFAFDNCIKLTSITIPNSVTTIGNYAFTFCGFTSVIIPSSVTSIGESPFASCSNLNSVTVNWIDAQSIVSIDDFTFLNIANDAGPAGATLNVPAGTYNLYKQANGWKEFGSIIEMQGPTPPPTPTPTPSSFTYTASEKLPGYYGSLDVGAFTFGPAITSHTFSNGTGTITCNGEITMIGESAFLACPNLTSITIPNSVTEIGTYAFAGCFGLTSITIPNSVTTISQAAFDLVFNVVYSGTATGAPWGAKCVNGYIDEYFVYSDAIKTTLCGCSTAATGSISIPKSVTTIGKRAFYDCSNITSVAIPNTVTTIGEYAFYGCTGLTEVTVGWFDEKSIVPINENMFGRMANDVGPAGATLNVPAGTADLYKQANGWKEFGSIIEMQGPTPTLSSFTYTASEKLPEFYIGSLSVGATTFGPAIISHEFSDGKGTITCAGEITQIGAYAFNGCTGLTSITIPNTVTTIGMGAFGGCSSLTSITIPQSVTTIGDEAFKGSSTSLTSIVVASGNPQYDSRDNCNAIIETATNTLILGCKHTKVPNNITTIGDYAFDGCYDLKDITLPNSVTAIGQSAFWECKNLTSITIPNSVTTIGINAFKGTGLTSITLPASVKEINEQAFWDCTGLSSVTVSWTDAQSIPSINSNVFEGIANGAGPSGATLHMPEGTDNLYKQADVWKDFGNIIDPNCKITYTASEKLPGLNVGATTFGHAITSHIFSDGKGTITCAGEITQIGAYAFNGCTGLTSITIPNTVTTIGMGAFVGCSSLTSITIPQSVTTIGDEAFKGSSTSLTSIVVASGNPQYDSRDNCNAIIETATNTLILGCKNTKVPNNITTIGRSAFDGCYELKDITLPNSVTAIGQSAFWECKNLTSITIPSSVTSIGMNAFAWAGLTSITLPASVKEINEHAFWNCTGLRSVAVNWTDAQSIVSINSNVFVNIANGAGPSGATLHVPEGTHNLYEQVDVWKDFGNIIDPNWKITYTASEKLPGHDGSLDVGRTTFGPAIISHEFSNGVGTITCSGEITTIGSSAFQNCTNLTSITLPNSVTTIGQAAFSRCVLTSITIPASVTQIGAWAFEFCSNLQNIDLPSSIRSIDEGTFQWAGLTSITIHASVERIEDFAFWACPLDYVISMSETPPALGNEATFPDAKKALVYVPSQDAINAYKSSSWSKYFTNFITDIEYRVTSSSTVEVISAVPFGGEVTIPSATVLSGKYYQVTGIADSAFYKEDSLVSILLPPTIKYIGANAFDGCTQLKQTNSRFWGDLQTIRERAFYGCTSLDSIVIPDGVQSIGNGAFKECRFLKYVSLPGSLRTIPDECFRHCLLGREIVVPEGVETIGAYGFEAGSDTEIETVITLPSTLKEIKEHAFLSRNKLKTVICRATNPPTLGDGVFTHTDIAILYVPNRDVMAKYRNSQWGTYKFEFKDLMAEENKEYLYTVAGNNDEAKKIANAYCDSIDQAKTSQDVQRYTNTALGKIDKITLAAYKDKLIDSLVALAGENIEAKQIAEQYAPQIKNAYFRQDAERLFLEAEKKINAIFELIALKENYITQLKNMAYDDPDLQKVAADYGALIQLAETKEQARALYERATMRIEINRQIKNDWTGQPGQRDPLKCSSTRGYINNH